jgi:hypothetical protein
MRHNLYGVHLGAASPVTLGAIESVNYRTGNQHRAETTSGAMYPTHVSIYEQKPVADFSSFAIQDCLDQVGIAGLSIATLTNGLSLYAYKHADGGGRSTGATHRKYKMTKGLVVPNRIACEHRGDALISYDILPTWDGTNDPVVESDTESVPAAPNDNERFTIGPVTIGSITIDEIRNFELDFGFNAKTEGADSNVFDTHASVVEMIAVLTLRSIKLELLLAAGIPRAGKAATHANTSFYLRKRSEAGAGFLANGTAEHIKGTMAGMAYIEDGFTGGAENPAEVSLKLVAKFDGTNLPIVFATASAIT